jgi:hypothetical protein
MPWTWGRLQRAGAVALVVLSSAVALGNCARSDAVPFLWPDSGPGWWMAPGPVNAELQQWGREAAPRTRFSRRFTLDAAPAQAEVEVRALGSFVLRVNGTEPPDARGDGRNWRRVRRVDVAPLLRAGENELAVEVENRHGPALLSLRARWIAESNGWPEGFEVEQDGRPLGRAVVADDTRRNPASLAVETPAQGLVRSAPTLALLALLGALAFEAGRRWLSPAGLAGLPGAALMLACLAWAWLFVAKIVRIPLFVGFDARHHLAYVDFLRERLAVPLATDGWSTFHPPLFYALAALLAPLGASALHALPWIGGLGSVFVTHSLAQRLYPGDARVGLLAVLFAAALPVNLYSSAYFGNESFHALLAGLALLAGVDALLAERTRAAQAALLGLWLGLAALTKFTALAIAPVALFFLACKLVAIERAEPARTARRVALCAGVLLAVCGWYYARNVVHFGTPIAGNWGRLAGSHTWWQQPGFHTPAWYLHFGESLRHPYLAGFVSFADGAYSTFWGDGGVAGRVNPDQRHPFWHHDLVSATYWTGLAGTALLAFGALRWLRRALGDRTAPRERAALSFLLTACYAVAFSLLTLTASLPYFAQAKGSYALCLIAPLALCFADGAARVDALLAARGAHQIRSIFAALLALVLGTAFLGYAA